MNQSEDQSNQEKQLQFLKQLEVLEQKVKLYLSQQSIARYGSIKAANPEKAMQVVLIMAKAIEAGQVKRKLTDEEFKQVLRELQEPKKEFRIKKI